MPAQAVFFDLDGTLMDTAKDITLALNAGLNEYGYPSVSVDQVRPVISYGTAAVLNDQCGIPKDHPHSQPILAILYEYYANHINVHTQCFDGVLTLLDQLELRRIPWGVISNKPEALVIKLMQAKGLLSRSCVTIGGDTYPNKKPHPQQLLEACKLLGVEAKHCLYVGDCKHDIDAANQATMTSIMAGFGFLPGDNSLSLIHI